MVVVRWIVGALLFVALLLLSLQNLEPVTVRFYQWWSWDAPLIFIVLVAFATGVAAGLVAGAVRSARLKRQLNRLQREGPAAAPPPARSAAADRRSDDAARPSGYAPATTPLDGV